MIYIAPSLLAANYANLAEDIRRVEEAGAQYLHLDIMDGAFVPNISFGPDLIAGIRKHTDMIFDVHLMIKRPERYIDRFVKAGADIITVHYEACENPMSVVHLIHSYEMKAGIAISPNTPVEHLFPLVEHIDMALIMTVEPGFGGQKFMADMMPKVKKLREMLDEVNPSCHLEVDGGVDLTTGEICKANGADVLVAGSAFYGAQDKKAFVEGIEA